MPGVGAETQACLTQSLLFSPLLHRSPPGHTSDQQTRRPIYFWSTSHPITSQFFYARSPIRQQNQTAPDTLLWKTLCLFHPLINVLLPPTATFFPTAFIARTSVWHSVIRAMKSLFLNVNFMSPKEAITAQRSGTVSHRIKELDKLLYSFAKLFFKRSCTLFKISAPLPEPRGECWVVTRIQWAGGGGRARSHMAGVSPSGCFAMGTLVFSVSHPCLSLSWPQTKNKWTNCLEPGNLAKGASGR